DKMYGRDPGAYLAFVKELLTEEQKAKLHLPYQALHAAKVEFKWRGSNWVFEAPPEQYFEEFHLGMESI
ncbi:MAG: RNA pseudouridine synthase, partial [Verrucomicrobiales bacterium]